MSDKSQNKAENKSTRKKKRKMNSNESDEVPETTTNEESPSNSKTKVYLPRPLEEDEELECDESAYVMYHKAQTGAPCLSFDVVPDNLGDKREDYPLTTYIVSGTQAPRSHVNKVIIMKMTNLNKVKHNKDDDDDDDDESSSSESENEDGLPELTSSFIKHNGCINRIRTSFVKGNVLAATWSEFGKVHVWNLDRAIEAVNNPKSMAEYVTKEGTLQPMYTFSGHLAEGFAMDWCPTAPGWLATGDCKKNIHVWKLDELGSWQVDQRPFVAHTASVEDIQWSPNEANVFSSCSVDKSIRIWDVRAAPNKACMLTVDNAHESDVNVISWNSVEPFLLSGGDDGILKVWDLRQFQEGKPTAVFKHHVAPITSVEWNPNDSTVFAASGSDDQLTIWDLAVEKDSEESVEDQELSKLPPQLLFIHQGQNDIKELHWHRQLPGVIISTAQSGFNIFRTISV